MEDLTFSEFAKMIGIPRTTLYTKLNQLKKNDVAKYDRFVIQNEDTLKIRHDRMEELKGFLQAEYKPSTAPKNNTQNNQSQLSKEVEALKKELRLSEERYEQLFRQYTTLNDKVQTTNDRLMNVIEELTQYMKNLSERQAQSHQPLESRVINRSKIVLEEDLPEEETSSSEGRFRNRFFK